MSDSSEIYKRIDALKASSEISAESVLPPGYIVGFQMELGTDGRIFCDAGVIEYAGQKVTFPAGRYILDSEWVSKSKLPNTIYYIYYTKAASFFVDLVAPKFNTSNFGNYHPTLGYRYVGKAKTDKNGDIGAVANHLNIVAENISFEEVDGNRVKANTISSKQMIIGDSADPDGDPIPDGAELFRYDSPSCTSHLGRKPVSKIVKPEQGLIGTQYNPWFKERRWTVGKGLVAAYTMNAGYSAELRDDSLNFRTGAISGASWYATGHSGYCLDFDGTDDYVAISNVSGIPVGNSVRSFAYWMDCDAATNGPQISINASSGQHFHVGLRDVTGTKYIFADGVNANNAISISGAEIPSTGAWHHIVFVLVDATTALYYLDGQLAKTITLGTAINTGAASALELGRRADSGGYFNGRLDEVRIYNRVITAAEVASLYAETSPYADVEAAPCDNAVWLGKTSTNLVTSTDLSDTTKWTVSATYQANVANTYDYELLKTVTKWNKGTDAVASRILGDGMLSSPAAGNYVQSLMIKCNYEINVRPYLNGTTPGAMIAGGVLVPANTWTLVTTRVTTAATTYTDIRWAFRLPGGGNFPADIEFRACDPYCALESYPMPFVATTRPQSKLYYNRQWAQQGTVGVWVKPAFAYNKTYNAVFASCYGSTGYEAIDIRYDATDDKFEAVMYDASGTALDTLYSEAIGTNEVLDKWWFLAFTYDVPNDSMKFYCYSADYPTGMTDTSAVNLGTRSFQPYLEVGGRPRYAGLADREADSLIAGLFIDDTVWTEADLKAHYDSGKVYYDPESFYNYEKGVYIDKNGIDIRNGGVDIIDNYGRQIDISNASGLLARDASGTVIHDIPTGSILSGASYLGHLIMMNDNSTDYNLVNTTSPTAGSWVTLQTKSMGNVNVKGVLLKTTITHTLASPSSSDQVDIVYRPYGSSFSGSGAGLGIEDGIKITADTITGIIKTSILPCGVSVDGKIEYSLTFPAGGSGRFIITQIGIYI